MTMLHPTGYNQHLAAVADGSSWSQGIPEIASGSGQASPGWQDAARLAWAIDVSSYGGRSADERPSFRRSNRPAAKVSSQGRA